jgi:ABC-type lipoprotein export system ATPase subunit
VSLLSVEHVTKRRRQGRIERVVLRDVSMRVLPGELAVVWGLRRSGRSTLLRVAAGMERPDEGVVCFDGRDLVRSRDRVLGSDIGYAQLHFSPVEGASVLDQVGDGLLAGRISLASARRRAHEMLTFVEAESCAEFEPRDLDAGETVRVAVARALVASPKLLVIDDPTSAVDLRDRDPILAMLRSVANSGVAVLMSTGDGAALAGVDHALTIEGGELRSSVSAPAAPVIPLRRSSLPVSDESRHAG